MITQKVYKIIVSAGVVGFLAMATVRATTVVTASCANQDWTPNSGYPSIWSDNFSTTYDVLLGLAPSSSTGDFTGGGYATRSSVTDGVLTTIPYNYPPSSSTWPMFQAVGPGSPDGGHQLIYTLSQATQIAAIQYYGGWTDSGRCGINFTVSYSADNGGNYTSLIDPAGGYYYTLNDPSDTQTGGMNNGGITTFTRQLGGIGPVANFVSVTDSGGYLGNGALITNLKFDFGSDINGWAGLEQLTALTVVPEPSVYAILGGGLLTLLVLRRRKTVSC